MDVYTDFFSYKNGIYSYSSGNLEGGHAILIVGYSGSPESDNGYFIVKNSWGADWGESGFFNIAYSQIDINQSPVKFGYYTIAYQEVACTYSISPTSQSFAAAGGTGTIDVTSDANCPWNAVSNASWITITSGKNGTGNGSVSYMVLQNTKKTARKGTMTVAGKVFTVTQSGR
jgi:hypothetical protein